MNFKLKYLLIGGAVVAGLAVVFSGILLYRGMSDLADAKRSLDAKLLERAQYYRRNPFPSPANVAVERRNAEKLNEWYESLASTLAEGQVDPVRQSPSAFMRSLGEAKDRIERAAAQKGVKLPQDFGLGFDAYFGLGSALPAPADVDRLTQQLLIVERLCGVLIDARAREVLEIHRQRFEEAGAPIDRGEASVRTTRRRPAAVEGAPVARVSLSHDADAGVLGKDDLYATMTFALRFSVREEALWDILQRLAADPMFVVARSIALEKTGPDVRDPAERKEPAVRAVRAERLLEEEPDAAPKSKRERIMSGREVTRPMNVTLILDVYRFRAGGGEES